jgi:hypothetical protein
LDRRILALTLLLSACGQEAQQSYAERTGRVCVDGVEYISFRTYGVYYGITPHLKPDGRPYTCGVAPTPETSQPVDHRLEETAP